MQEQYNYILYFRGLSYDIIMDLHFSIVYLHIYIYEVFRNRCKFEEYNISTYIINDA